MEYTPLIKQYFSIVDKYPGAIVLMRVGDFYETYGPIAVETSKALGITLTKRSIGTSEEMANMPLSGFPYHALDNYLSKFVQQGYKVAICDQLEDPSKAKGLVKRGVTEYITPGLVTTDAVLQKKSNNYLSALFLSGNSIGVAFLDFSTGEFSATQGTPIYIQKLLDNFEPNEIIFSKEQEKDIFALIDTKKLLVLDKKKVSAALPDWVFKDKYATDILTTHFGSVNIKGFGLSDMTLATIACGAILQYLKNTGHDHIQHITSLKRLDSDRFMWLDKFTINNLEIINPQHANGSSLIDIIDETVTPMGGRLLRKWLLLPLKDIEEIRDRQDNVKALYNDKKLQEAIREALKDIIDIERVVAKISIKKAVPKDFIALKNSLRAIKDLEKVIAPIETLRDIRLYPCQELREELEATIAEDPTQSDYIKRGVSKELDEYKTIKEDSNTQLKIMLHEESRRTMINSLKIGYNKIYGYYFEVPNAHRGKVPEGWVRKQTLTTGERYINDTLKVFEDKIINAGNKIIELENDIYNTLLERTTENYAKYLLHDAAMIAQIDCFMSFATTAKKNKYACPNINNSFDIDITAGRHPVIERCLQDNEYFVPNDIHLDKEKQQIILLTGPNMAGKSALLRQVALISLLAQVGSFVPAKKATMGVVDKIFTRVGATDNISTGESTFMMEMSEAANIMHNISDRSLIIMDEIGRGTSTYDGISIAWAILEYLHNCPCCPKTLFATHYHELSDLEKTLPRMNNYSMSVLDNTDKIIFLRKLEKKKCEHSFGINVAKLAGLPQQIITRAEEILKNLERIAKRNKNGKQADLFEMGKEDNYKQYFNRIKQFLEAIDVNTITPVEALVRLQEMKKIAKTV